MMLRLLQHVKMLVLVVVEGHLEAWVVALEAEKVMALP
jgi:hypothetical protein